MPKPVSPDVLRRTLLELRDQGSPAVHTREPLGELNVSQLVDRLALELRRGLVEAVDPQARSSTVGFGEGTDIMSAVWGTVARLRELVTLRSDGNVRFEQTGPEGAVPLAPWNDDRRVAQGLLSPDVEAEEVKTNNRTRLWKCRSYGNHKTISTRPWKSRREREIPTFPQADPSFFQMRRT